MYIIGQEEIDAMARVVTSKALFRYGVGHECERFEQRYAAYLGATHFSLAASGSYALTAAMIGLGIGPGDEVLVPAHTYMASATSVLAAGAIPVIVDVNESITIEPGGVSRVELKHVPPQDLRDVGHPQRSARMAGIGLLDGIHRQGTDGIG